jgi:HEAT repeat protein
MDEEEDEKEVLPVLTQALSDEDPEVRMAAIQALSEFSEETPIESLGVALGDEDAEIRFEALSIVAELSDERAQPLISQALDDPDEDVRSLAEGLADMEDIYEPVPAPAVEPLP